MTVMRGTSIGAFICGCMLAMLLVASHSASQTLALEKLTIGVSAVGPDKAGLLMAKEAGFFKDQGLDAEFMFFPSSTTGMQALVGGQVPVVSLGVGPVINAVLAGAEVTVIAELVGTSPYTLVVLPEILRPADLKGRRLGVNRYGATADFALRFALAKLGLDPKRDVTILQIGETSLRLAALQSRSIDGTVIRPPENLIARKLGFRELVDMASLGLKDPSALLVVSKDMIQKRPETLRRVLTAVVLGTHAFKTRRGEAIPVLGRYLKTDDSEVLAETYAAYSALMHIKPFVAPEGVQMVLDQIAGDNPKAKTAKPQEFFDMRFVRVLDESGVLDRLYKR